MNSAYFSSLSFMSSSTRIWMVADLGCLGGAFSSGKYDDHARLVFEYPHDGVGG